MKELKYIKDFYFPIQPTVKADSKNVMYVEVQADPEIENFIYCFWQLKSIQKLESPFVYRVVSDGCIDIFFEHSSPSSPFIMGFCKAYTEFVLGNSFNYIGIRFLPSAFPIIFGINAKMLSNQSQNLSQILPDFTKWISQNISSNYSFEQITILLNTKIKSLLEQKEIELDLRFHHSLQLIFQQNGCLALEKDLKTGVSSRQLRRIFNYFIGTTPKVFSNVVRFQYVLRTKLLRSEVNNTFYLNAGFFDQAHFIKDFKKFYGILPSKAFR